MKNLVLKQHPPLPRPAARAMPPGAGLLIAGLGSVVLWSLIAAIV